jgi:hypothetical protein
MCASAFINFHPLYLANGKNYCDFASGGGERNELHCYIFSLFFSPVKGGLKKVVNGSAR